MRKDMFGSDKRKLIVGVTGGFGTGKTTVANIFRGLGAKVISCDQLAHEQLKKGKPGYKKILKKFAGDGILQKNGNIDRKKLGKIVFSNKAKRKALEKAIHPHVIKKVNEFIKQKGGIIVVDIPLLFEVGYQKKMDRVIVVDCAKEKAVERTKKRDFLSAHDIKKRIKAQQSLSAKRKKADYIIHNSGDLRNTLDKTEKVWKELMSEFKAGRGSSERVQKNKI